MRAVPLAVAVVAAALYLVGLGAAPFLDPPEGFHAAVAREMAASGDWITPRANGVRYLDRPPVLYWLMSASFALGGLTPFAARLPSALAAVGCAAVTARLGVLLGGPRLGLLAGLMTVANLGMFVAGRLVRPDLPFVLLVVLAQAGFAIAYRGGGRRGLVLFYASLGAAAMTKGLLGALGPLVVVALFLWLTRERPVAMWAPWWGGLVLLGVALPWYLLVAHRNPGFLRYTLVDDHWHTLTRQRLIPGEDVPLAAGEFLLVTALAFLPWTLAVPWGVARALRRPWPDVTARLWVLFALWALAVVGAFTLSPFRLPLSGLPAFPALALLSARVWVDTIEAAPGAVAPRRLLTPILVLFLAIALALAAAWAGRLTVPGRPLDAFDVAARSLAARGQPPPEAPPGAWAPILGRQALVFGLGAAALAVAVWRRAPALGVGVALATMLAFLPSAGQGMAQLARVRSARPIADVLAARLEPADVVVHEGPIERSASILLRLSRPVRVVDGLDSHLAFGATFPDARDRFWNAARLRAEWGGPGRRYLVSTVTPERSVVRSLPEGTARVVAAGGGRWLYANADR